MIVSNERIQLTEPAFCSPWFNVGSGGPGALS